MTENNQTLPHWDLTNVYPSLDSPEFKEAMQELQVMVADLDEFLQINGISRSDAPPADSDPAELGQLLEGVIDRLNTAFTLLYTASNYISSYITTDSYNTEAKRLKSQIDELEVKFDQIEVMIKGWIGTLGLQLQEIINSNPTAKAHAFFLQETAEQSRYLMSDPEESLAAELSLSGIRAWNKLHGTITSQLKADLEVEGEIKSLPLPALQNVRRYNLDESVRQRAFDAEIDLLASMREPLAACMNGVKGYVNVLNRRRGRKDALHPAIDQSRIDRLTLEAMMSAMQASFPTFRKYLKAKAKRFGKEALPWWDLFAPVGQSNRTFNWEEAKNFIVNNFSTFSQDLGTFAERAFDRNWIDAEPRDGKRGGAFCMRIAGVKEPRILCNFDGSLDQVSTIAHELGHGYHIECQKDKEFLQFITPMTLAETASIFCETIIQDAALEQASSPDEQLAILETALVGDTQVIVDITSRFMFEKEVFERREEAELSADDFCDIITRAQKATYGQGLDEEHLHPYMWAWKPHYYREDISFYNYPYAFGLLFSTGLYAIYQQRGADFVPDMVELLASTGLADAADLAARFDIDIRTPEFWEGSLEVVAKRIDRYMAL
jgi:pepF/M3 family oligoendopeptidase